jgi:Sugar phosphate isomerases/epimerases
MKVGYCIVNYSEKSVEEVVAMAAAKGYEAVEIPAYVDNGQIDAAELLKGNNASNLRKMVEKQGLFISAISNHADSLLVLGPFGKDTDSICPGTKEQKIKFGTESLLRSAQLANILGVPVVIAFSGIENFGHICDWPYSKGWADEEAAFVERYVPILDKFKEYGVKLAFEPHPNNIIYDTYSAKHCIEIADNHPCLGINFDPANILVWGIKPETFIYELGDRIFAVHAKDCEIVEHDLPKPGIMMQGEWGRPDRSFRLRIPGWGNVNWKSVITELYKAGYDYVISYEHEDATMSRADGIDKTISYLKPLMIHAPYEGRNDKLFTV